MPPNPLERRSHVFAAATMVTSLTIGAMVLAAMTIGAVVLVANNRPDQIPVVVPMITGIAMPLLIGVLALAQKFFSTVVDGQLGQLLHATEEKATAKAEAAHAKGKLEGIEEAPKIVKGE